MIKINVRIDYQQAIRKLNATEAAVRKALPRALNKVATTARADAARQIRDVGYGMKVSVIKKAISIERATQGRPVAILVARGTPLPLVEYSARQTRQGVSVAVLNGRKLIKGAFIATMSTGHRGVFMRTGNAHQWKSKGGRKRQRYGLPIKEKFGPAVPDAVLNPVVQTAIETAIRNRFPVVFRQELKYAGLPK